MKAIIQCYTPQECERIANGEQTVKVCKTAPKETPFKVYIYKSKHKGGTKIINNVLDGVYGGGKVVMEYMCDKVSIYPYDRKYSYLVSEEEFNKTGLTGSQFCEYGKGKPLYGLHISELKIYDEPRGLGEFTKPCPYGLSECMYDDRLKCYDCNRTITRPPQSWCYVENS